MKKYLAGAVVVGAVIGLLGAGCGESKLGGSYSAPFLAATSSVYTVGPTVAVNIAATSTGRSYVRVQNTGAVQAVLGFSKPSTVGAGEIIGPITSSTQSFMIDQDHLFTGSVWAISAATTTLNVAVFNQ